MIKDGEATIQADKLEDVFAKLYKSDPSLRNTRMLSLGQPEFEKFTAG